MNKISMDFHKAVVYCYMELSLNVASKIFQHNKWMNKLCGIDTYRSTNKQQKKVET